MTDADPKAIAYAAAFVGAAVSLVTAVLVTWLNDRTSSLRPVFGPWATAVGQSVRAVGVEGG